MVIDTTVPARPRVSWQIATPLTAFTATIVLLEWQQSATPFTKFQWVLFAEPSTEIVLPELPPSLAVWKQDLLANISQAIESVRLWRSDIPLTTYDSFRGHLPDLVFNNPRYSPTRTSNLDQK